MKITAALLQTLYIDENKSLREIGLTIGTSPKTVGRYLKKFGIQARPFSTKGLKTFLGKKHSEETKQKLREQKLGKELSPEHRAKVIKTLSSSKNQTGETNSQWKGGKYTKQDGYIYLRTPNHPRAMSNGYMAEHRLVMEKKISRLMEKYEHVHHLNGIKDDNRPENLELVNGWTHNLITRLETVVRNLEKENKELKALVNKQGL